MPGVNHVLLTRFNLPTPGLESLIRARDGWLRERVDLFERYCVPSVSNQTNRDFDWLVYLDPQSPDWVIQRLQPFVDRGQFRPIYRDTVSMEELASDIRETVRTRRDVLITTNVDNDDGLAVDFSQRLVDVHTHHERAVMYISRGLIKSPDGLYLRTDRRNAFVSVRESWERPVTSWSEYHNEFARVMPVIEIGGPPGWLQVVHGSNVSNRVRGRLATPRVYRDRFGDLVDGVREPGRLDIAKDLLIFAPARTMRDTSRAVLRRSALRLLGKERYGKAKLLLASMRRS